eukprot:gene4130-20313_t
MIRFLRRAFNFHYFRNTVATCSGALTASASIVAFSKHCGIQQVSAWKSKDPRTQRVEPSVKCIVALCVRARVLLAGQKRLRSHTIGVSGIANDRDRWAE